jgi:hypothetical protein
MSKHKTYEFLDVSDDYGNYHEVAFGFFEGEPAAALFPAGLDLPVIIPASDLRRILDQVYITTLDSPPDFAEDSP